MFSSGVETGEEHEALRIYLTQKVAELALSDQAQDHSLQQTVHDLSHLEKEYGIVHP